MRLVLDPLVDAGIEGMEVVGGDGHICKVHLILACYVADYPEQCLVTCSKSGTCQKCLQKEGSLGERTLGEPRMQRRVLHQLYQGIIKYLLMWCSSLMSESELDCRLQAFPQCFSVRHFKCGWSRLTQVSGKERKQMVRVLLGCLVGKVSNDALTCYRALLDFLYLVQYPSHDDDSLQYMEDALTLFHDHKQVFVSLGIREHFNIPKFHSLLHYMDDIKMDGTTDNYNTKAVERLHIDLAKDGWRASNTRNAIPQMTKWLERQEKIEMFRQCESK